ncbi:hypothetical protein AVEN_3318-1, partial [Araneus ventricosus]
MRISNSYTVFIWGETGVSLSSQQSPPTFRTAIKIKLQQQEDEVTGDKIENCFGQIQKTEIPEEFDKIAKECCPGVGDRKTGKEVREWYCSTTVETIQK